MTARQLALAILQRVIVDGRSLDEAITRLSAGATLASERALARAISYGVMREYLRLQAIIDSLLQKRLKAKDTDINLILCIGIHQLDAMRIPDHAAINETVILAKQARKQWASGLVNAILRRFQREKTPILEGLGDDPVIRFSHPQWFITQVQQDWQLHWQDILNANNQQAPLTLRVNLARRSREEVLAALSQQDIDASAGGVTDTAISLTSGVDVTELPGFEAGDISVQDGAAQLAATLLQLGDNQRILDACAAPGGKTAHILEILQRYQVHNSQLLAIDKDAHRLQRVTENLQRLGLQAEVRRADAADSSWWDGPHFDRILLDAPCSASGVIRRHPDIKFHRQASDIEPLCQQQRQLLHSLWQLLQPGGILLYATCSVLQQENSAQIAAFLQQQPDAVELPISAAWGRACQHGRQILPAEQGMDGFYYARLQKQA